MQQEHLFIFLFSEVTVLCRIIRPCVMCLFGITDQQSKRTFIFIFCVNENLVNILFRRKTVYTRNRYGIFFQHKQNHAHPKPINRNRISRDFDRIYRDLLFQHRLSNGNRIEPRYWLVNFNSSTRKSQVLDAKSRQIRALNNRLSVAMKNTLSSAAGLRKYTVYNLMIPAPNPFVTPFCQMLV